MREDRELANWKARIRETLDDMAVVLYPKMPREQARFRKMMWVALYSEDRHVRERAASDVEKQRVRIHGKQA